MSADIVLHFKSEVAFDDGYDRVLVAEQADDGTWTMGDGGTTWARIGFLYVPPAMQFEREFDREPTQADADRMAAALVECERAVREAIRRVRKA